MAEKHFVTTQPPASQDQAVVFTLSEIVRLDLRVILTGDRQFELSEDEMLRLLEKRRDERLGNP